MTDYDKYSRHKHKSHKYSKSDKRHKQRYDYEESKTPPLPSNFTGTMQDLLKQRETLRNELKKITVSHTSPSNSKDKSKSLHHKSKRVDGKRKLDHKTESKDSYSKKKTKDENEVIDCVSPESNIDDNISVHSDVDEEVLIEERRIKRKQLIEKLEKSSANLVPSTTTEASTASNGDNNNSQEESCPQNDIIEKVGHTDMFAETDFSIQDTRNKKSNLSTNYKESCPNLTDNWDDPDGYYNVIVGETLNNRYTVKKIVGQGVFSNVIHAHDTSYNSTEVAIKMLRNNDLMYKTGLKEIAFLRELNNADPHNKYHCIRFITKFMHRGHLCMVLEAMHIDLRFVLKKYGKHHGLNMKALHSYSVQLLLALKLLKKVGIVHCDIKPDNILVNEKKNVLKLCDLGSACKIDDNDATPYLVSRFYRAPEIILGINYDYGIDLWSSACTIYELATGKIMFTGNSNNKMLKYIMNMKGKIPHKVIRKGRFKDQHFDSNYNFLYHKKDEVTEKEKVVEISNFTVNRNLHNELKHAFKEQTMNDEKKLSQLKDLLDKMIMLDPTQRPTIGDCLKHPFIIDDSHHVKT